jgi:ActR/RegA family two-component response regulator
VASVIALLGFADRGSVTQAREAGAVACLDWPCDVDDLVYVLDRTAASVEATQGDPAHPVPPSPVLIRRRDRVEVVDPGRSS